MPRVVRFHVEGKPIPQGSIVADKQGGKIHYYNRSEVMAFRKRIRAEALAIWGAEPSPLPISLTVIFAMRRPLSHYRSLSWQVKDRYAEQQYQAFVPDIDKLARAVLDALTGVAYQDDAQVARLDLAKMYSNAWGTTVHIAELAERTIWEVAEDATSGTADALQMGDYPKPSDSEG